MVYFRGIEKSARRLQRQSPRYARRFLKDVFRTNMRSSQRGKQSGFFWGLRGFGSYFRPKRGYAFRSFVRQFR